jgi:hypothetical protein
VKLSRELEGGFFLDRRLTGASPVASTRTSESMSARPSSAEDRGEQELDEATYGTRARNRRGRGSRACAA